MAADPNVDPFASIGGGVYSNGGWVPKGLQGKPLSSGGIQGGGTLANDQVGKQVPAAAASGTPPPITTQGQVGSTQATVGGQTAQGAPTTVAGSFQQALVNRLNPQAVSASNPQIAPAIQANHLSEQRSFEGNRNLLAERAAANGQSGSGGFETGLLGLAQDRAGREAQFAGNAVNQLGQQQNANTTSALSTAGGLLGQNANLAQQQTLADLDAAIRREALTQQGQLGNADIGLRSQLGNGQLNLGLLSTLLQNQQYGQGLGAQLGMFGAGLDNSTLQWLIDRSDGH